MRSIPFKDVFDRTVRLHGRDPRKNINSDFANALTDHINSRVNTIWAGWRWPEWERTEERAFRTVWNDSRQFVRENAEGVPDELYYITTGKYYRVISSAVSDPPIGTVPTDGSFFDVIDSVETFIEFDQECKRSIGVMLGVFSGNPRITTCSCSRGLDYMPSERGIDVCGGGTSTVWITYKKPCPSYTMTPYLVGKTYSKADLVFDQATGECFQARIETTAVPTDTTKWNWIPFLETWTDYVRKGAFSDSLLEFDQGGNQDLQAKVIMQEYWNRQADDDLQSAVDTLVEQGQRLRWNFGHGRYGWCQSCGWCGGEVLSLSQQPFDSIVTDEVPIGLINSSNTVYTTAYSFATLWVYLNGLRQTEGGDYTVNGSTGFTMVSPPTTGDTLLVDYVKL